MTEPITGLPKETNGDVPNVQKRGNIFVRSAICASARSGLHRDCFKDFHIK